MKTSVPWRLPFGSLLKVHLPDGGTLHRQLEHALRSAIRDRLLPAGTRLPPSRQLADEIAVSRGVVVEAYAQLVAEGYLMARTGAGTWVADHAAAPPSSPPVEPAAAESRMRFDFRPGLPDLSTFPRPAWTRALLRAIGRTPPRGLGHDDPCGPVEVRLVLAAFLARSRAAVARQDDIIVTGGIAQGLALACQVLRRRGHGQIAIEDPGYVDQRRRIQWHGLEAVPIPVDGEGLRVDDLARSGVGAVLVTAAHQYPTGVVLSAQRRATLVEWARSRDGWIVEDDYDAEYRYDAQPVGCLQGLACDRVIHVGTASKMLAPGLRLGWLIAPAELHDELSAAKRAVDMGSPQLSQWALADLIESGELDRHLRRTRVDYRQRRDCLVAALAELLPAARVQGIAAGLHVTVELPTGLDEAAVERSAAARSVTVRTLSRYCIAVVRPPALVLGYSRLRGTDLHRGVALLAEAVAEVGRG